MYQLVLLRHGQSVWNKENRFTGWTDVDLTEQGIEEAKNSGRILREEGFSFDVAYTSLQRRAIRTLWFAMEEMDLMWIPVHRHWRLNERHYGALQGLNKAETAEKYGDAQVLSWRRSYTTPPPALELDDERHPSHDPRYASLSPEERPASECLADVVERFLPIWKGTIGPMIQTGKRVLITAHGNSLRALVKHLDQVSDEDIVGLNIPTGVPLLYELDKNLRPISHRYLGDAAKIAEAIESVANQGKSRK